MFLRDLSGFIEGRWEGICRVGVVQEMWRKNVWIRRDLKETNEDMLKLKLIPLASV